MDPGAIRPRGSTFFGQRRTAREPRLPAATVARRPGNAGVHTPAQRPAGRRRRPQPTTGWSTSRHLPQQGRRRTGPGTPASGRHRGAQGRRDRVYPFSFTVPFTPHLDRRDRPDRPTMPASPHQRRPFLERQTLRLGPSKFPSVNTNATRLKGLSRRRDTSSGTPSARGKRRAGIPHRPAGRRRWRARLKTLHIDRNGRVTVPCRAGTGGLR